MPVVKMGELTQTCAPAGFRHPREAEIDTVGEDDGKQGIAIVGFPTRTPVDEAFAEPGPGIDLKQKIGDRQSVVAGKSVSVRVDLGGRSILKKTQNQTNP